MNQDNTAKILQEGANGAVVQLPGRKFPGVVIQGDSLSNLIRELMDIREKVSDKTFD